ncbi:hypothetical protein TYRP_015129 [Tyrophagus putrescentiae]|nr:hypothetical protein TYRP_015129 [Tyrophagus putrescentiae]
MESHSTVCTYPNFSLYAVDDHDYGVRCSALLVILCAPDMLPGINSNDALAIVDDCDEVALSEREVYLSV